MNFAFIRGHEAREDENGDYRYVDTGEKVMDKWQVRACGVCNKGVTEEGHDPCLGTLPGVKNACCGHGVIRESYIQYENGEWYGGEDAHQHFKKLITQ